MNGRLLEVLGGTGSNETIERLFHASESLNRENAFCIAYLFGFLTGNSYAEEHTTEEVERLKGKLRELARE